MRRSTRVPYNLCTKFGGVLLSMLVACSSETPCETAHKKLDACKSQIDDAIAKTGFVSLPVAFTGNEDCSGKNLCIAECVDGADCSDLAIVISGGLTTDPNAAPYKGTFLKCTVGCL